MIVMMVIMLIDSTSGQMCFGCTGSELLECDWLLL